MNHKYANHGFFYQAFKFGFLTLSMAYLLYIPAVMSGRSLMAFPFVFLSVLGGLAPMIVGVLWLFKRYGSMQKAMINIFSFHHITRFQVMLLAVSLFVLTVTPVLLTWVFDSNIRFLAGTVGIFLPIGLVFGALEEVGWRGVMQERLNHVIRPVLGSLLVGVFWMLWHVPLFFIDGTYQQSLGLFTSSFWVFNASLIIASPFYTWLLYQAKGFVPVVMLYHGFGNLLRELLVAPWPVLALVIELLMTCVVLMVSRHFFFLKPHQ